MNDLPSLTASLRDRTITELRALLDRIRRRRRMTRLEQVAAEVGPSVYEEMEPLVMERPVWVHHGRMVGLPAGTYALVLAEVVDRRTAEMTTLV